MSENGHRNGNGHAPLTGYSTEYHARPGLAPTPLADRMPPRDLTAEKAFLGSILLNNDVLREIKPPLIVSDFALDDHGTVYQAMLDLDERGEPIDAVTLAAELTQMGRWEDLDGLMLLREICEATPHSLNAENYANIIRNHSVTRRAVEVLTDSLKDAYSGTCSAGTILNRLTKGIASIEHGELVMARDEELSIHPLPEKMDDKAFYGPVGQIVRIVQTETEACPESILMNLLTILGNAMGPAPHWAVNGETHRCNLFIATIGASGQGRKGTAYGVARWIVQQCQGRWVERYPIRGLTSGEGLICAINDAKAPLVCLETEFGGTLDNIGRQHCNLGSALKQAWDGPHLGVMTKNNPVRCEGAYISVIAHLTYAELKQKLGEGDIENGLVNRFMWIHTYRSRLLPRGGNFRRLRTELDPLLREITSAVDFGNDIGLDVPFLRTAEAEEMWDQGGLYASLTAPRAGFYGAATMRRAQLIMRLAVIFAMLDRVFHIEPSHLHAAMAVWDYCDQTAAHIWGSPRQEGDLEKLVAFIEIEKKGVTKTDISRKVFGGHMKGPQLDRLLAQAQASGQIVYTKVKTGGPPRHEWIHKKNVPFAK